MKKYSILINIFGTIIFLICCHPNTHMDYECTSHLYFKLTLQNNYLTIKYVNFELPNNIYVDFKNGKSKKNSNSAFVAIEKINHVNCFRQGESGGISDLNFDVNDYCKEQKNIYYQDLKDKSHEDFYKKISFYDANTNFIFQITNSLSKISNPQFDDNEKLIKGTITIDQSFIDNPFNGTKNED